MKFKVFRRVVISLAVAIAFAGCNAFEVKNEEEYDDPQMSSNNYGNEGVFYAKVENASKYRNVFEVKLMVYDKTTSRTNGNVTTFIDHYVELARSKWKDDGFSIPFPETLASNHFRALIRYGRPPTLIDHIQSTMAISNENVKVSDVYFVGVDKNDNVVATFSFVNTDEDCRTEAIFTYVDSDVTISGYTVKEGHAQPAYEGAPSWIEKTTTYSVKWEKGLNIWFFSTSNTIESYKMITSEKWSIDPVSGLKWFGSEENVWKFQI